METRTLFIILVLAAGLALYLGYESGTRIEVISPSDGMGSANKPAITPTAMAGLRPTPATVTSIELKLPAVDKEGNGILADLAVEKSPGAGGFYLRLNKDSPLTNPDTQASMRTAFEVAKTISKATASNYNLYYSFNTDSDAVGGKSAGAAMTVASIALIKGEQLRPDTLITGTIEADGRIGKVGKVLAKARAVKKYGYRTLIVPRGEGVETQEIQDCTTEVVQGALYNTCKSKTVKIDVEEETGLDIIEVENARQAYELMRMGS